MDPVVIDFHTHPYLSGAEFLNFYPGCFTPSAAQCREDLERAGISMICGCVLMREPYRREEGFACIRRCNMRAAALKNILAGSMYRVSMCTRTL